MKLKLDENIPADLVDLLKGLGFDADTVPQEGLAGCDDEAVWAAAQSENRFLITQDLDFSDIRRFVPGTHAGILVIRMQESGLHALENRLLGIFKEMNVTQWIGCLVIATDHKLRIRSAPEKGIGSNE